MDILFYSFSVFYLLLLSFKGSRSDHCTQTDIDQCWQPVETYIKTEGHDPDDKEFALFHLSTDQIKAYCHLYLNSTSHCLSDLKGHCSYNNRKLFEGYEDASDYFCNEGLDTYLQHKDCIGGSAAQSKIHDCTDQFENDYFDLLYTSDNYNELEDKFCEAVYNAIDCDTDAVNDICGDEAADWVETYETKLYDPYMEQYNCHRGNNVAIITGVIITVVCILVIVCCIVTCVIHHKKQKQLQARCFLASSNNMAFYNNNGTAEATGQPQVAFGAAPSQGEKNGIPPEYQLQTPPFPGVFMQPTPPPAYSTPHPANEVMVDNSHRSSSVTPAATTTTTIVGDGSDRQQPQTTDNKQYQAPLYEQPPPQYGSEWPSTTPQYTALN